MSSRINRDNLVLLKQIPTSDEQRKHAAKLSRFLGENYDTNQYHIECFYGFIPQVVRFKTTRHRNLFLLSWGELFRPVEAKDVRF